MMQQPLARLDKLHELNSTPGWINRDLYRLVCSPELLGMAYGRIKSKTGNMTPGVDGETLDGFSIEVVRKISERLKDESFQFRPSRRHHIPKSNGKTRPLGIPSPRDKVVQEAIRLVLEAIYDSRVSPTFLPTSHGFREGRSTHTAIGQVRLQWGAPNWVIEGDIKSFFDEIDHEILLRLLRKRIADDRFLNLIRKALSAGYMENDNLIVPKVGTPQGSVISPILANIYLHEFDVVVQGWCQSLSTTTKKRASTAYRAAVSKRSRLLKASGGVVSEEVLSLTKTIRTLPSQDHSDPNAIRVGYVRYADDWVIGITGPKLLAEDLKDRARVFLRDQLKLTLSLEKTKITNLRSEPAHFLGFMVKVQSPKESKVSDYQAGAHGIKRRVSHGSHVDIQAPVSEVVSRLHQRGFCDALGKPTHHNVFIALTPDQMIHQYNLVMRGIANYYSAVINFSRLNRVDYILRHSLAKTLANRERSSVAKQFKKRGRDLSVAKTTNGKRKVVRFIDYRALRTKTFITPPRDMDRVFAPGTFRTTSRLGITDCAVKGCSSGLPVEMHHVKHVRKMGKTMSGFTKLMATLNRKQVPLCTDCHKKVHGGRYDGLSLRDIETSVVLG